jgi:TPR repeat protein
VAKDKPSRPEPETSAAARATLVTELLKTCTGDSTKNNSELARLLTTAFSELGTGLVWKATPQQVSNWALQGDNPIRKGKARVPSDRDLLDELQRSILRTFESVATNKLGATRTAGWVEAFTEACIAPDPIRERGPQNLDDRLMRVVRRYGHTKPYFVADIDLSHPDWYQTSSLVVPVGQPASLPTFVERDAHETLVALIETVVGRAKQRRSSTISVVGPPKSGKTRLAIEALKTAAPGFRFLQPDSHAHLHQFVAEVRATLDTTRPVETVVFLDDLQYFADNTNSPQHTIPTLIKHLAALPVLIMITGHTEKLPVPTGSDTGKERRERFRQLGLEQVADLINSQRVNLPSELTKSEKEQPSYTRLVGEIESSGSTPSAQQLGKLGAFLSRADIINRIWHDTLTGHRRLERTAILGAFLDATFMSPQGATLERIKQLTERRWNEETGEDLPEDLFDSAFRWCREPDENDSNIRLVAYRSRAWRLADALVYHQSTHPIDQNAPVNSDEVTYVGITLHLIGRHDEALQWLTRAAEDENPGAMVNLAMALFLQRRDPELCLNLMSRAAHAGHPEAMYFAATALKEKDKYQAVQWLGKAATQGLPEAMFEMGFVFLERLPQEAVRWWKRAAKAGNADAAVQLYAHLSTNGSPREAKHWIMRAAELGSLDGIFVLGASLVEESLNDANIAKLEEGEKLLRVAAAGGHSVAISNLAALHEANSLSSSVKWRPV